MDSLPIRKLKVDLQPRDFDLLLGLYHSRVMWREHIAALYFHGSMDPNKNLESAKKRLQDLQKDGLVVELRARARRPYQYAVYHIGVRGFRALQEHGKLDGNLRWEKVARRAEVSEKTLKHELTVITVRSKLEPEINAQAGFVVEEFSTWPVFYEFKARYYDFKLRRHHIAPFAPDGFFQILSEQPTPRMHRFFLEVDLTKESHVILAQKADGYQNYYRSGDFAAQLKHDTGARERYKEYPFRVLMVVESAERRNNAADFMLRFTSTKESVLMTTLDELKRDPLGAIYVSPLDYYEATKGTPYEVTKEEWHPNRKYVRNVARDRFVEGVIHKNPLLVELKLAPMAASLLTP